MKLFFLILTVLSAMPAWAAVSVPLTVKEAVYPGGTTGVARANEPFCMGVPLADSAAITSTGALGLSGASAGQFRVLGKWPSGNYKWVKVCGIVPALAAGSTTAVTLGSGSGNFGGSDLATDAGATITVSTGAANFTIKKANFNGIDSAVVGSVTVVASSSSSVRGLVVTGPNPTAPYPGNVTCSPDTGGSACTTIYSSANDAGSTAVIEENGPVMAVIRATGNHMAGSGHVYMQYTARLYFYKGSAGVKASVVLRNANYDTTTSPSSDCRWTDGQCLGGTFNSAYKGLAAYELRITPNITGPLTYTIEANATQTGTLDQTGGTDSAYVYQGQSRWMIPVNSDIPCDVASPCANTYTTDSGFVAKKNSTTLATGTTSQYPQGWADIRNSSGAGIEIGMHEFAAQWPASLEFNGGGTDVRIGMFSARNSKPVYQAWPHWAIKDLYLNFHSTALSGAANEFLKMQHPLLARASVAYYNSTSVFPYAIAEPAQEDAFYVAAQATSTPAVPLASYCWSGIAANCTPAPDRGATDPQLFSQAMTIGMFRAYGWNAGGPMNQEEHRWSDMLRFLQRGDVGRWTNSANFYRFVASRAYAHADGGSTADSTPNHFTWRSRPYSYPFELNGFGGPLINCNRDYYFPVLCGSMTNSDKAVVSLVYDSGQSAQHAHIHGIFDYYFLTGDETIRDAIVPIKDFVLSPATTYQQTGRGSATRNIGIVMTTAAKMSEYLAAIGDPEATGALNAAKSIFTRLVKPDTCVGGYPTGCTAAPLNTYPTQPDSEPSGVNRKRGVHTAPQFRGSYFCTDAANQYGIPAYYRAQVPFQSAILTEGILNLRRVAGPLWSDYQLSLDLAYGMSQWALTEGFSDDGQNHWFVGGGTQPTIDSLYNGFRFGVQFDHSNVCPSPSSTVVPTYTSLIGGKIYNDISLAEQHQSMWLHFLVQKMVNGSLSADQLRKLRIAMHWIAYRKSNWPADWGGYQLGTLVDAINNPSGYTLQDIPFSVSDLGGGNYRLSWTVPAGAQSYRIKWSPLAIAPSTSLLNFDIMTNTFGVDPATNDTWFGANNVTEPAPATAGTVQTLTITGTGKTGLTTQNFSVKGYVAGGGGAAGPASNLVVVSGNGQTGTAGQQLANPFVVKATDAGGNPVSGVTVSFTVTTGGGTLTAASASTNASGLAFSTLTLGAAAGTNAVRATSGTLTGSPITFTATGVGASGTAANLVLVSGNGQTGTAGQQLANPLVVKATDASGGPVSGVLVTFTVTGGGGTLTPASVSTNSSGLASSVLTLGSSAGTNTITAASGGLAGSPVTFVATAGAATGPAANLVLVSGNSQTGTVGQQLASPFVVKATDASGNPVSGVTVTFTVTAGGGTLSPATAATNSSGLASSTLTLGATVGTNTARAASGSLSGSPITFTANGISAPSGSGVSWMPQTPTANWPGYVGWMVPQYDPVSQQILFYVGPPSGAHGIYSTDIYAYKSATNVFTHISGTGSATDACPADSPTQPGDRHPGWQMAVDTKRNLLWLYGGVNGACQGAGVTTSGTAVTWKSGTPFDPTWAGKTAKVNGVNFTIASVTDSTRLTLASTAGVQTTPVLLTLAAPDTNPRQDMYYLKLNPNPADNTWNQITPAHLPATNGSMAAMIYDPDNDVLFAYGYDGGGSTHDNWIYCRTAENPIPGVPTVKQLAAGCLLPDDWNEVSPLGGTQPPGAYFPGMVYDPVTKKVIMYGGGLADGVTFYNQTWAYDVLTHKWTQKALSTAPPPVYNGSFIGQPAMVYNSSAQKVLYRQSNSNGAPADWQYDTVADVWQRVPSAGGGATGDLVMAYDALNNRLVSWSINFMAGRADIWLGGLSGALPALSPCDLNGDGITNATDVQVSITRALGLAACGTGDLNSDGKCNVIDTQIIINAFLGGGCLTGQ